MHKKKVDKNGNKVPVLLARKQINGHFMVANIALNSNKKTIYVLSAYKNKEIPELEANASKNALAITPEATQNLEISFDSIKPNFGTDVNTPRYY